MKKGLKKENSLKEIFKSLEEALRFHQFSTDHVADAVYWMGPDAKFIYVNKAACLSLGYTGEELLQMSVFDIDPNFTEDVWPAHWKEIKKRGSFVLESQHRKKDGTVFPVSVSVNYLEYKSREYNIVFARDITEHKKEEEALKFSEANYRAIYNAANDAIFVHAPPPLINRSHSQPH